MKRIATLLLVLVLAALSASLGLACSDDEVPDARISLPGADAPVVVIDAPPASTPDAAAARDSGSTADSATADAP